MYLILANGMTSSRFPVREMTARMGDVAWEVQGLLGTIWRKLYLTVVGILFTVVGSKCRGAAHPLFHPLMDGHVRHLEFQSYSRAFPCLYCVLCISYCFAISYSNAFGPGVTRKHSWSSCRAVRCLNREVCLLNSLIQKVGLKTVLVPYLLMIFLLSSR